MSLISLKSVSKSYPAAASSGGALKVLEHVDLEVAPGEFVALLGPSGSGKSTLLHLIGGLDRSDSGRIEVGGRDLQTLSDAQLAHYRNESVGVVFQFFNLFPSLTVLDNVRLPGILHGDSNSETETRARGLLGRVGLEGLSGRRANELSGGEMQRVALCRALLLDPPLLLADEPTGNLDSKNGAAVMDLLTGLGRDRGMTVVTVTHDEVVARRADRLIRLKDGRVSG